MSSLPLLPIPSSVGGRASYGIAPSDHLEEVQREIALLRCKASLHKTVVKVTDLCCLLPGLGLYTLYRCFCGPGCWCGPDCNDPEPYMLDPHGERHYPSECTACDGRTIALNFEPRLPPTNSRELWGRRDLCVLCFCCAKEGPEHYLVGEDQQNYRELQKRCLELIVQSNLAQSLAPPHQAMDSRPVQKSASIAPVDRDSWSIVLGYLRQEDGTLDLDAIQFQVAPAADSFQYVEPASSRDWERDS